MPATPASGPWMHACTGPRRFYPVRSVRQDLRALPVGYAHPVAVLPSLVGAFTLDAFEDRGCDITSARKISVATQIKRVNQTLMPAAA